MGHKNRNLYFRLWESFKILHHRTKRATNKTFRGKWELDWQICDKVGIWDGGFGGWVISHFVIGGGGWCQYQCNLRHQHRHKYSNFLTLISTLLGLGVGPEFWRIFMPEFWTIFAAKFWRIYAFGLADHRLVLFHRDPSQALVTAKIFCWHLKPTSTFKLICMRIK